MEPANFPEIYTGNEDESDRMQDIAGCFDPIIPRNDGFQYDIGKDKPGAVGRASLSGSGTEKSSSPGLRYFSAPAPAPRAYESSRGNRPVRDIKPHNILFIACAIKTIKFVRAENT